MTYSLCIGEQHKMLIGLTFRQHYASQCRTTVHSSSSSSLCRNKRVRGEEEDKACDEAMDEEFSENSHNRRGDIKLKKTSQPSGNQSADSNSKYSDLRCNCCVWHKTSV